MKTVRIFVALLAFLGLEAHAIPFNYLALKQQSSMGEKKQDAQGEQELAEIQKTLQRALINKGVRIFAIGLDHDWPSMDDLNLAILIKQQNGHESMHIFNGCWYEATETEFIVSNCDTFPLTSAHNSGLIFEEDEVLKIQLGPKADREELYYSRR